MTWRDVARAQDGVISARQLRAAGLSWTGIERRAARGELERVAQGVFLVGGAPETARARLWVASLLTAGVLVRGTAGALWGVREVEELAAPVRVAIEHRRRRPVAPPWIVVHRSPVPPPHVTRRDGLAVSSRRWTVLDLVASLPRGEAAKLADRAVQRGWIEADDCARRVAHYPGRQGNARLRELAPRFGDGAAAESERVLHRILRAAGIGGWRPNHPIWVAGELIAVLDVAFPERRLAIEIDGMAYHVDAARFQHDRSRQNQLVALGWTVLRFTWADLIDRPGYVAASIRRCAA